MTSGANLASSHQDQEGSCSTSCFSRPTDNLRMPKFIDWVEGSNLRSIECSTGSSTIDKLPEPCLQEKVVSRNRWTSGEKAAAAFLLWPRYNPGACTGILPRCTVWLTRGLEVPAKFHSWASINPTPGTENTYCVSFFFFSVGAKTK